MVPLPPPGGRPMPTAPSPFSMVAASPIDRAAAPKSLAKRRKERGRSLPTLPPRIIPDAEKVALATYEAELGGRLSMVAKLAHAQLDADGYRFLQMVADPEHDRLSLAEICQRANTPIRKVTEYVKAAVMAKATLLSTLHIAEHTPSVALGVMQDAISGERTCEVCRGTTQVPGPDDKSMDCPACQGKGTTHYEPEVALRKMALSLGGLLGPTGNSKGSLVSITNNNLAVGGVGAASATVDKLTELTDRLLYGTGRDRLSSADADGDEDFVEGDVTGMVESASTEAPE